jgi:uncharacterized protein
VSKANAERPLDVYRYFRTMGVKKIQFIPVVNEGEVPGQATEESVTGIQYGNFLISVFDEWYANDMGSMYVFIFEHFASRLQGGNAGLCVFEPTCGLALALEHTGDLYACDHYVSPEYLLGNIFETNIAELVNTRQQYDFGVKKAELPTKCLECNVRFICNGGCPKNRILPYNNEENKLNYLCDGYTAFFNATK